VHNGIILKVGDLLRLIRGGMILNTI